MATKEEVTSEVLAPQVEEWTNSLSVKFIMGEDTSSHTELLKKIVDMVGIVRKFHDEAAKEQGNPTIRGQKESAQKTVTAEDAAKKLAAALAGK